jgi:O-antigen ligase
MPKFEPGAAPLVLLLTLPWLNPFASGPSPAVMPWLVTLLCLALALLWFPVRQWVRPGVLATAWLAAALLSAAMGLAQYFGLEHFFAPWVNLADGQAYANLRQRNQFASLTSLGLAALLWWTARDGGAAARGRAGRYAVLLAAAVLALGTVASASRTGLVQLLLLATLAACWGTWRQRDARQVLLAAGMGYGLGVLVLPWLARLDPGSSGILARFQGEGCGSRLVLWRNVLELIGQRPWGGWGWGALDYAHFMHQYDGPRFCQILGNAHNLPLQLAVELGVPVALLICTGLGWLVWRAQPWRERDPARQMAWGVLAVIGLHSLLEFPLWYGPFLWTACLSVGLLWVTREPLATAPHAERLGRWQVVLAALLLSAVSYAAWDYQRISQIYRAPAQRLAAYRDNTLAQISGSWLFARQVRFAELSLTPVTRANAARVNALAQALLHYSPEARVVEKLIESAVLLGRDKEALLFLARYRAAYPQEHARWAQALGKPDPDAK